MPLWNKFTGMIKISCNNLRRCSGTAVLMLFLLCPVCGIRAQEPESVFWRYGEDRYGRPALTDPLAVPPEADPYDFLAGYLGYSDWMTRRAGETVFLSARGGPGRIPVLCLHKIGRDEEYALSAQRLRRLLRHINSNRWYLISDRQYLTGDFSRVPTGFKPIVMGADDATYGSFEYQTRGDSLYGEIRRNSGRPLVHRDSMVPILERYIRPEEGRINFTFYISFDAVPFRQLGGPRNPGFPYRNIPLVAEKIQYIDKHFILGIHTLTHTYANEIGAEAFAQDVLDAWELIDEYAGGRALSVHSLSYPYGIAPLTDSVRQALIQLNRNGIQLSGGFDLDNRMAFPVPEDPFEVSRFNADNRHWNELMQNLRDMNAFQSRREVIFEVGSKKIPQDLYSDGVSPSDPVWVLVRPEAAG